MNNLYLIPSSTDRKPITILSGDYESRYFEIVTYQGHPNAYVSFPEGINFDTFEEIEDFGNNLKAKPHGGFSFIGWVQDDLLMVGWDYNHHKDFNAIEPYMKDGKKWTLTEILTEVISVIDAINSAC